MYVDKCLLINIFSKLDHNTSADLVLCPAGGDIRSASVPENQVSHAVHTWLVTHLGPECRLIAFHICMNIAKVEQTLGHIYGNHLPL